MSAPVWIDGRIVASDAAHVSALDLGLRSGVGVFESLRVRRGATFRLAEHLGRARIGASSLGIRLDPDELARAVEALLDAHARHASIARTALDDVVVRLTITAGPVDADAPFPPPALGPPTRIVTLHPAPPLPLPPARAITLPGGRGLAATKTTSYAFAHHAEILARAAEAELALLVEDDHVVEAATANVLALLGDTLVTPPVGERALAGILRGAVLDLVASGAVPGLAVEERALPSASVMSADAVLVGSAVSGLRDVVAIDGTAVGIARRDRATASAEATLGRLRDALDAMIARESDPIGSDGTRH